MFKEIPNLSAVLKMVKHNCEVVCDTFIELETDRYDDPTGGVTRKEYLERKNALNEMKRKISDIDVDKIIYGGERNV